MTELLDSQTGSASTSPEHLRRALNLFEFLGQAQRLKTKPVRTTTEYSGDSQSVLWLTDIPAHPAVVSAGDAIGAERSEPLLSVDKVPHTPAPPPPSEIELWVEGPFDAPQTEPRLRQRIRQGTDQPWTDGREMTRADELLSERPDVQAAFDEWMASWRGWAHQERLDSEARALFTKLFAMHVTANDRPEEYELLVGVGCLTWLPGGGHPAVKRHLLTAVLEIEFDDTAGRLRVQCAGALEPVAVEVDMLEPSVVTKPDALADIRRDARGYEGHILDSSAFGPLERRLVNNLDLDGEFSDHLSPAAPAEYAQVAHAPALILRKRNKQGLVEIYRDVVDELRVRGSVPAGVVPLVDPDHPVLAPLPRAEGAMVSVGTDVFLPLPVNDKQLRVIADADAHAQTLVQGPPGTGKTHTAAALLSHLLAQGKRVLVTAQTDRALREVRGKLPEAIKPLSVSVVGGGRKDMSDLRVAVERISAEWSDRDEDESERAAASAEQRIEDLGRRRAAALDDLVAARAEEVREREYRGVSATLAEFARRHREERERYQWITEYDTLPSGALAPVTDAEACEWLLLVRDKDLPSRHDVADETLLAIDGIPRPDDFAEQCRLAHEADAQVADYRSRTDPAALEYAQRLSPEQREVLRSRIEAIDTEITGLQAKKRRWFTDAMADVLSGRRRLWDERACQIEDGMAQARRFLDSLGAATTVEVQGEDIGPLRATADSLHNFIGQGGKIKVRVDGQPKIGVTSSKVLKESRPFFDRVRVNGVAATTPQELSAFCNYVDAERVLDQLDKAWPSTVEIPDEDTLFERLHWHAQEHAQLTLILSLGDRLVAEADFLASTGLPQPYWHDSSSVRSIIGLVDAADAEMRLSEARAPLTRWRTDTALPAHRLDGDDCVARLAAAIRDEDGRTYHEAYAELAERQRLQGRAATRDRLAARLSEVVPGLVARVGETAMDPSWDERLATVTGACSWAAMGAWIAEQDGADVNAIQTRIGDLEEKISQSVGELAAERAWTHAVSPDRLTGTARADLNQYATLVRKLGKGTGKYAAQQKEGIRKAMDRCRSAVPVWIMPIYRISEQLQVTQNMFDVVIVDEASQAGLESVFLQYVAPKIIVIGDDKQVSPSAVGLDRAELRGLADQYLQEHRFRDSWQDPTLSLFDEAKMLFGKAVTLTEHRRCMPEIIGFSNRIAYEPDGVALQPVRQFGADRLEPIKAVHVAGGLVTGKTNKVNQAEVDAIVDQISACLDDARYDGQTFGVISLLGKAQAKALENALLERISPEVWQERELRCGDAPDFQGSERDVMFLSLVAAPQEGRRIGSLTQMQYLQRFNVAASRAKNQLWLFHSVPRSALTNPEDLRYQLVEYCYEVIEQGGRSDVVDLGAVPEDALVDPFWSLFEQHVYTSLRERGYRVVPKFEALGYPLDLVVVGDAGKAAVVCDGDQWDGPEAYARDLAHERDLQRCGWRIFRVRESAFYTDRAATAESLVAFLDECGIHPIPDDESADAPSGVDAPAGDDKASGDDALVIEVTNENSDVMPEVDVGDEPTAEVVSSSRADATAAGNVGAVVADPPLCGGKTVEIPLSAYVSDMAAEQAEPPATDASYAQVARSTSPEFPTAHDHLEKTDPAADRVYHPEQIHTSGSVSYREDTDQSAEHDGDALGAVDGDSSVAAPLAEDAMPAGPTEPGESILRRRVLDSPVFERQLSMAGNISVSRTQFGDFLDTVLGSTDRSVTTDHIADVLGVSPSSVNGALLQLKKVLDVDGYQVVTVKSGFVEVDEDLLREQFGGRVQDRSGEVARPVPGVENVTSPRAAAPSEELYDLSDAPDGDIPTADERAAEIVDERQGEANGPSSWPLPNYTEFLSVTVSPSEATVEELVAGVIAVVAEEGPVVGARIRTAFVHASGGRRVGSNIARKLDRAMNTAVNDGVLILAKPLDESGWSAAVIRLPGQPAVQPRRIGPRTFEEVPADELATIIDLASIFRRVGDRA